MYGAPALFAYGLFRGKPRSATRAAVKSPHPIGLNASFALALYGQGKTPAPSAATLPHGILKIPTKKANILKFLLAFWIAQLTFFRSAVQVRTALCRNAKGV